MTSITALWVLQCALLLHGIAAQQLPATPARKKVVCTAPYWPLTQCAPGQEPSGYEIELYKLVGDWLARNGYGQWAAPNVTFKCSASWDASLEDIQRPAALRQCDVFVGGVSATLSRRAQGIQFSYPTLASGRRIMIHVSTERGMWSFLVPFEPSLWLAYFATSVFVGLLLLVVETPGRNLRRSKPLVVRGANMQWGALGTLLRITTQLSPRTTGGRLILLGYGFLVFILANLYIASMSAILSARSERSDIEGMEDLVNRPVGIFVDDRTVFQRFVLNDVHYMPWSTTADEAQMMSMLRSGEIQALVLDSPWVQYTAASNCDMFVVGDMVLPVDLGYAFPNDTSPDVLGAFDSALSYLDDLGVTTVLQRTYLQPADPCHSIQLDSTVRDPKIRLGQVAGLWVFLAGAVGLCVGWNLAVWTWRYIFGRDEPEADAKGNVGPEGSPRPKGSAAGAGGPLSSGRTYTSKALAAQTDEESGMRATALALNSCATQDEALQALQEQISSLDNLIRHLPFVVVASVDARMQMMRNQILSGSHVPGSRRSGSSEKSANHTSVTISTSGSPGTGQASGPRLDAPPHRLQSSTLNPILSGSSTQAPAPTSTGSRPRGSYGTTPAPLSAQVRATAAPTEAPRGPLSGGAIATGGAAYATPLGSAALRGSDVSAADSGWRTAPDSGVGLTASAGPSGTGTAMVNGVSDRHSPPDKPPTNSARTGSATDAAQPRPSSPLQTLPEGS